MKKSEVICADCMARVHTAMVYVNGPNIRTLCKACFLKQKQADTKRYLKRNEK